MSDDVCRVGDAESSKIIPAQRYRVDDIIEQLSEVGNEADAWRVVEVLAPKLAGPWEMYGNRMSRPKYARCTAFLVDDTEARDAQARADGWRLCR